VTHHNDYESKGTDEQVMKHNDWLFGQVTLKSSQVTAMLILVMTVVNSVHRPDVIKEISCSKPGIRF
jgi:hypothetical protein